MAVTTQREPVRPGYKLTDMGVIPIEWKVKEFGSILKSGQLGGNYPNQDQETEYPLIKMGNIDRGSIDVRKIGYIPAAVIPNRRDRLRNGDLLFNTRNTLDLVGKVAMWRDELPVAYYNSNLMRVEFKPEEIASSDYANYAFNSPSSLARLRAVATGTTSVAAIYTRDLLKVLFAVPPLPEQDAIGATLSDVDALIASLDMLVAKKRDIKTAAMQQLLTGKRRLPGFGGEWELKRLGDVGTCLRGVSYKGESDLSPYDTHSTKRLLRANNVQNGMVAPQDIQFVNAARVSAQQVMRIGDILICMANGSKDLVGKAAAFSLRDGFEYTFGAFMGCFRCTSTATDSSFVFFLFQTGRYRNYIGNLLAGSSINNLRPSAIESLEFAFPHIQEQSAIATVLSEMDADILALQARRDKAHALKQGMMQQLLTGSIRLV